MAAPIRPDQSCVPQDLQGAAAWFQNWNDQMQLQGLGLGFAQAELDRIKDDNTMVQFLATSAVSVSAFASGVVGFRRDYLTTPNGSPNPSTPTGGAFTPPGVSSAGIWDRLNHDIDKARASLAFTSEVGALLGINPIESTPTAPGDVKPTGKLDAAMHGYLFSTVVAGREEADQWQVWVRKAGTTEWMLAATATGKSVDVTFDPGAETGPIALEVYIQLRKGNANYGQPSDIGLVTVNP